MAYKQRNKARIELKKMVKNKKKGGGLKRKADSLRVAKNKYTVGV
tara:strand:- start:511 stop:645 length:135 start_codon:yes stop_codon:yes gene_type:complete